MSEFETSSIIIKSAAVADYKPINPNKINKKKMQNLIYSLLKTLILLHN